MLKLDFRKDGVETFYETFSYAWFQCLMAFYTNETVDALVI